MTRLMLTGLALAVVALVLVVAALVAAQSLESRAAALGTPTGLGAGSALLVYGEEGSAAWRELPAEGAPARRIVLLVHGLDEPGTIWDDLAPALHEAGHTVVRFEYPNDQRIALSTDLLMDALRVLRARGVGEADLVCHSMGGLVARDALTRDTSARTAMPEVHRLVLVATPNHGSALAALQPVSELREVAMRAVKDGELALPAWFIEGRGEAALDLAPDSAFLRDLNARPLPRNMAITIIAGSHVGMDAQGLSPALRALLGDGVVSLDSAVLEGVEDVVVVGANHRFMLKRSRLERAAREALGMGAPEAPAIAIILERLER